MYFEEHVTLDPQYRKSFVSTQMNNIKRMEIYWRKNNLPPADELRLVSWPCIPPGLSLWQRRWSCKISAASTKDRINSMIEFIKLKGRWEGGKIKITNNATVYKIGGWETADWAQKVLAQWINSGDAWCEVPHIIPWNLVQRYQFDCHVSGFDDNRYATMQFIWYIHIYDNCHDDIVEIIKKINNVGLMYNDGWRVEPWMNPDTDELGAWQEYHHERLAGQ